MPDDASQTAPQELCYVPVPSVSAILRSSAAVPEADPEASACYSWHVCTRKRRKECTVPLSKRSRLFEFAELPERSRSHAERRYDSLAIPVAPECSEQPRNHSYGRCYARMNHR
ncbi:hypothetical protein HPB50_003511 [Hyalomma asiaticum]|uniref:Uncharacterized protein n=1 Tax=Hyalomma asiaticum TaxID=266040 RepID=A0ACB7RS30_HYAAI|nr:hypothetical protein HPB50_003511 [Hyalomma asiaticum]